MGFFGNCVLTDSGRELLADVLANESSIIFTGLSIGNGIYEELEKRDDALKRQTALKALRETYGISYGERTNAETIRLSSVISNMDPESHTALFETGFYINEIGIMAKASGDSMEVLYAIAVTSFDKGDYLPAYDGTNPQTVFQDILAAVTNETLVQVEYAETALARAEDLARTNERLSEYKADVDKRMLIFSNVSIPASLWAIDNTYEEYPFHADIPCSGVTADYIPMVTFSLADAVSGNFAPVAETGAGRVRIWAAVEPGGVKIVPSIVCERTVG